MGTRVGSGGRHGGGAWGGEQRFFCFFILGAYHFSSLSTCIYSRYERQTRDEHERKGEEPTPSRCLGRKGKRQMRHRTRVVFLYYE